MKESGETSKHFDYIIIGSGVAGFHIAMQMESDPFFLNKSIAVFDNNQKGTNDKTFCFWEKGKGNWESCVSNTWNKTIFNDCENKLQIDLIPYTYKKINAIDFYRYCQTKLKNNSSFSFFTEEITTVKNSNISVSVTAKSKKKYTCDHVFDSRLEIDISEIKKESIYISQSFEGWFIKTTKPTFNSDQFTMMDYSHRWKNSTSFMYILPISSTEALLEYTFFAPSIITNDEFDNQLGTYMENKFPDTEYKIIKKEAGVIPMTTYNFKKHHSAKITKIGTAGGWVKASTGYSFKFAEKNAVAIMHQLKQGKQPTGYKSPKRFSFYDTLLLKILAYENKKGPSIFLKMYKNTTPKLLFKFLDEETSLLQEIKIISRLPYLPFIKAVFKR